VNTGLNLKTAVESGRLAEAVMASALVGFVRRTNRCAFTNPPSTAATTSSRNTSPPTAALRITMMPQTGHHIHRTRVFLFSFVENAEKPQQTHVVLLRFFLV
jgi:hypothetical protein